VGPAGFYPEFRAVGVDGKVVDYLEVEAEAVRLAELIALRETNLPLAVGLFGNWGSGKSHFMGLLRMHMLNRANAARRTDGATDGRWCKEIVPIVFNAWHYLDSNLWASLVSEIFERLFERLQPKGDALQKVQEKLREVGGAMARAQEEVVLTQAAVTKAAGELQAAQREAEQAQTAYAGMMDEFKELLPEFKEPVSPERIADLLGVEPELATLSALKKKNQELAGLAGQVRELSRRIIAPRGRAYRMGVLFVAGCLGPLLLWLVQKAMPSVEQWLKDAGVWVRPALEWVTAVLTAVTPFFIKLQKRLHEMRDLQKQAEDAQKVKEKTPKVKEAKEQLETANAVATQAELQLAETKARQRQIQREMEELAPGRRVSRFIEDRARSVDYRGQLGLVSLARSDFV
jgi:DNA repair exonuclease SbcCD ATPase subunit